MQSERSTERIKEGWRVAAQRDARLGSDVVKGSGSASGACSGELVEQDARWHRM